MTPDDPLRTPFATRWAQRARLVPLTRLTAANAAADAFVTVALAETLFFGVPVGQARGRVALYLVLTMVPFALVAPVIGPLLDRARSGRRTALAVTLGGRAVLAWFMSSAVGGLRLYPAAFAVLVLSKGYGVARSAAVPRLLPPTMTLVGANAQLSFTALIATALSASMAASINTFADYRWTLRVATVLFVIGSLLAWTLPNEVNHEQRPAGAPVPTASALRFPPAVRTALVAAVSLRALAGYLTLFLAFLLRKLGQGNLEIGVLAAAAAAGGMAGTALGALLRERPPSRLLVVSLGIATFGTGLAAWQYGLGTAAVAGAASGLGASLSKLALDATLQRDVDDAVRGQAFARSETALQLAWVVGGGLGIALPQRGSLGLGLAAAALVVALVVTVRGLRAAR